MDADRLTERLRPILAREPRVAVAWLFGSAARGEMRPASDVDVGVVFVDHVPRDERDRLLADLSSRLDAATAPHPVDLVALEARGAVFVHRVLKDSRRIVVNDEKRRVDFESDAHVQYLDFKPTWDLAADEQVAGMRRWLKRYIER